LLSAQAHSFQQQSRLAISLSWIAGYTNVLTLIVCGQATSHMSGVTSSFGRSIAESRHAEALYLAALLVAFLGGALLSGLLMEFGRARRWDSMFVLPMSVEAVLLAVYAIIVDGGAAASEGLGRVHVWSAMIPAVAMGLQNATITRISGGVVRTTHVTGVVTDIGIESASFIARRLSRRRVRVAPGAVGSPIRALLLVSILGSYAIGAGLGALAWGMIPDWALVPAVAFVIWIVVMDVRRPIASIEPRLAGSAAVPGTLPADVAVYHIQQPGKAAAARRSRMPNLTAWADHLSADVSVVVLDLTGAPIHSSNASLDIVALARRLADERKTLILAGVERTQEVQLRLAGLGAIHPRPRIVASMPEAVDVATRLPRGSD